MSHVYHWKHGWIPLDHEAALSKAKGNHAVAAEMLHAHSGAGIHSRQDVAKAALTVHEVPAHDRPDAVRQVQEAAVQHGAQDLLPKSMRKPPTEADLAKLSAYDLGNLREKAKPGSPERALLDLEIRRRIGGQKTLGDRRAAEAVNAFVKGRLG